RTYLVSPCRARTGLQASAVTQADCMQSEFPSAPLPYVLYCLRCCRLAIDLTRLVQSQFDKTLDSGLHQDDDYLSY
ncbi:MAG: hypothetical protein ACKN9M_08220, partial [Burkholderiaceae bacterium]